MIVLGNLGVNMAVEEEKLPERRRTALVKNRRRRLLNNVDRLAERGNSLCEHACLVEDRSSLYEYGDIIYVQHLKIK